MLVTLDLYFANIQAYPPERHFGIIVLCPHAQDQHTLLAFVTRMIAVLSHRSPSGELWIAQRDRIRFRRSDA